MHSTPNQLRPAQSEVHRTAHDQDLVEVQRRARLERESEGQELKTVPKSEVPL